MDDVRAAAPFPAALLHLVVLLPTARRSKGSGRLQLKLLSQALSGTVVWCSSRLNLQRARRLKKDFLQRQLQTYRAWWSHCRKLRLPHTRLVGLRPLVCISTVARVVAQLRPKTMRLMPCCSSLVSYIMLMLCGIVLW
jgi:hypothetical protein